MEVCLCLLQQEITGKKGNPSKKKKVVSPNSDVNNLLKLLYSQVIVKLKSKHVGGAFSKKNKCKRICTF